MSNEPTITGWSSTTVGGDFEILVSGDTEGTGECNVILVDNEQGGLWVRDNQQVEQLIAALRLAAEQLGWNEPHDILSSPSSLNNPKETKDG